MKMIVKGRHMAVTQPIHDYAEEKIGRLGKILDQDTMTVEVEIYHEKNPSIEKNQIAEVTVWITRGPVIRAKEASMDMYAAIDLVSEKLETQFRKYKGKMADRHSPKAAIPPVPAPDIGEPEAEEPAIVKTKSLELKPMTPEEAILQLELLGHDFFVFTSAETETVSVLYRRNDGDYGLIEPQLR
ncbi:MAG: ribosome-associated translation inhibitor RaiA [Actinomycetota bacterium]|nr:ribosome-associated translation inhibitor RaiA [Actinomycetota bacterium]